MRLRHLQTFLPYAILGTGLVIVASFLSPPITVGGRSFAAASSARTSLSRRRSNLKSLRELMRVQTKKSIRGRRLRSKQRYAVPGCKTGPIRRDTRPSLIGFSDL